jgi:hypothetical protein
MEGMRESERGIVCREGGRMGGKDILFSYSLFILANRYEGDSFPAREKEWLTEKKSFNRKKSG